jgi:hypothetical protein
MKLVGEHNRSHEGELRKTAVVHWSQQRAWPGDEVTLSVRTEQVPDGAALKLAIRPAGADQDLDTVSGQSISAGKLDYKYTIQWQNKPVADHREFVAVATIDTRLLSPPSAALRVDLEPPCLSA